LNFTNENKFVIGIKFIINIIDENTDQQKLFEEIYPHKILFREILQKFTTDVGLDNGSFEIYANKNTLSQQISLEDFGESLFEDILYEYGNALDLKIKKSLPVEKALEVSETAIEHKCAGAWDGNTFIFRVKIQHNTENIITNVKVSLDNYPSALQLLDEKIKSTSIIQPRGGFWIAEFKLKAGDEYFSGAINASITYFNHISIKQPTIQVKSFEIYTISPLILSKDLPEERKKELKKRATPKAPPPGGAPAKTMVATEREILSKAFEKAPLHPQRVKEEREEELADLGAAELEDTLAYTPSLAEERPEIPQLIRYDINMGFQIYSVMMERCSYLFYIYFSHEELIIEDDEGKTIVKTKFTIENTKKEPPVLDIKVEREGFEVHPLIAKLLVKKDAVNPPVMIFSVLPVKSDKKKKDKKHGETRFLHRLIDFENKIINHTVLAITVQPKHFHLYLGPIHVDIGKTTATFISIISLAWAVISVIYSLISVDISSTLFNVVGGFAPSLISILFVIIFFHTLIKGVYPLKRMWNNALNFDKASPISK